MKTFKAMCNYKPSVALEAMCRGLETNSQRKDFRVDMNVLVELSIPQQRICYGCAATCAVMELTGIPLTYANAVDMEDESGYLGGAKRAELFEVDPDDLCRFEMAIDDARAGDLGSLSYYFCDRHHELPEMPRGQEDAWYLDSDDWQEQLPRVRAYIQELQEAGL